MKEPLASISKFIHKNAKCAFSYGLLFCLPTKAPYKRQLISRLSLLLHILQSNGELIIAYFSCLALTIAVGDLPLILRCHRTRAKQSKRSKYRMIYYLVVCAATDHKDGCAFSDLVGYCMVLRERGVEGDFLSCFPLEKHFMWIQNDHNSQPTLLSSIRQALAAKRSYIPITDKPI